MKPRSAPERRAWAPFSLAGLTMAAALASAYGAHAFREQARQEREAAAASHGRRLAERQRAPLAQEEARRQAILWQEVEERGWVGEPAPEEWEALVAEVGREFPVFGLHPDFQPPSVDGREAQELGFHGTVLRLRFDALHEETVLRFLEAVARRAQALVRVRSCRLSRPSPSEETGAAAAPARLAAECELEWARVYGGRPEVR